MTDNLTINKAYKILFKEYPDVVSAKDVSKMLGIGIKKTYKLIHNGEIKSITNYGAIKVAKISVINYVLQTPQ